MLLLRRASLLLAAAPAARCLSTAPPHFQSWTVLQQAAGPVPSRLFTATERLFGAAKAEVVFWRDAAGWCPFCEMTWLLLEKMQLPYQMKTVQLRRYMLPGEAKDPTYLAMVGADGVVPGVQFRQEDGSFGEAIQSVELIFAELLQRFPSRYPLGDAAEHARACQGDESIFGRLRVARRSYEACAGAADKPSLGPPLAEALRDLDALLACGEKAGSGPFIGGADAMSVADLMILPFLERTESVVPYFFGMGALAADASARGVPFSRAARYLQRARESDATYCALWSDATTLARTNLRYAEAGAAPRYSVPSMAVDEAAAGEIDGTTTSTRDAWAAEATDSSRREAAARLAANPQKVAAFARRSARAADGASDDAELHDGDGDDDDEAGRDATDDALRAVASLLLRTSSDGSINGDGAPPLSGSAQLAADAIRHARGAEAAASASAALEAFSVNIGVPRDMGVEAARALRSHCRIMSAALSTTGFATAAEALRTRGCTQDDLIMVIDFDLTLTDGKSDECHDIMGASPLLPPQLVAAFEPLLDFSQPFPPELEGDGWWVRANELLVEHGAEIGPSTPRELARAAPTRLRPGARALLRRLRELGVPVLVVSAGISDLIEAVLDEAGVPTGDESSLTVVSSNRLVFAEEGGQGAAAPSLIAVEPSPPITSLNKALTYERNREWFEETHAARKTLLVVGDRVSDLKVASGAPDGYSTASVGIFNDTPHGPQPAFEEFESHFDAVIRGDEGSLDSILSDLVEGLGKSRE